MSQSRLATDLPTDEVGWHLAAKGLSVLALNKGIHAIPELGARSAASKLNNEQYLTFRAIWKLRPASELLAARWLDPDSSHWAEIRLSRRGGSHGRVEYSPWQAFQDYMQVLKGKRAPNDDDAFSMVHHYQTNISNLVLLDSRNRDGDATAFFPPKVFLSPAHDEEPSPSVLVQRRAVKGEHEHWRARASLHDGTVSDNESPTNQLDQRRVMTIRGLRGDKPEEGATSRSNPVPRVLKEQDYGVAAITDDLAELDFGSPSTPSIALDYQAAGSTMARSNPRTPSTSSIFSLDHSPFDPRLTKAANDEMMVNQALIEMLNALTIFHSRRIYSEWKKQAFWSMGAMHFNIPDILQARTDGYLHFPRFRTNEGMDIAQAIVEVKARVRQRQGDRIREQETAQIVAWIHCAGGSDEGCLGIVGSTGVKRRVLIAQDHGEAFVVIAEYDEAYRNYICRPSLDTHDARRCFLVMNEYGPFNLRKANDVHAFARFILVLTLTQMEDPAL